MKESYIEGLATHDGPESCAGTRKGTGEALTGESAGWVLSREIKHFRVPTLLTEAEGNISEGKMVSSLTTLRGRRPHACADAPCARTGRSTVRLLRRVAVGHVGKTKVVSR
jgi:RNA-directed DNA polymerase